MSHPITFLLELYTRPFVNASGLFLVYDTYFLVIIHILYVTIITISK